LTERDVSPEAQPGGVHSRRVIFIDLARALAAVFMLYGHTVSALLAPRYQTGTWFDVWLFQRGLTSSLFLLLSGFAFSIATGRHWSSHVGFSPALLRRVRRFALFVLLGYALHFPVQRFVDLPGATPEQWRSFLAVDVLQLIGVTFLGVQALVMMARSRTVFGWTAFVLAVAAVLATPFFWSVDWNRSLPLSIASYLSPAASGSQFPLFPWVAYVLVGAALGQWYLRWGSDRLDWYANVALFAPGFALVTLAFVVDALPSGIVGEGAWDAVPTQVALRMGASLILLSLITRASQRISRLPHVFGAVAQETLLIYFVHLCIVYGSIWNRGLAQSFGATLGPGRTLLYVVLLIAAMAGLALYWNWWKHTRPRVARWMAVGAGALLLFQLL
jgi:acyltransferase